MSAFCHVRAPVARPDTSLTEVPIYAVRHDMARRLWRVSAADGTAFGFELERPLRHGDTVLQAAEMRYVIRQQPEAVLIVNLEMAGSAAAGLGWAFGNMHLEASTEPGRLIVADSSAARRLLERIDLPFTVDTILFCPGHFARGTLPAHELGPSHQH